MFAPPPPGSDPDRFVNHPQPGSHEWWYFDAISADGRDALVIVWYAGLPFDPAYGVAAIRHEQQPDRYPAPKALDHAAIGLSWYRDGKTVAYALNAYRADAFAHQPDPWSVAVGDSRVDRDGNGYRLSVRTPAVDGKTPIRALLRFQPAGGTEAHECDLGTADLPHLWSLVAADCRVEGRVAVGDTATEFTGRGYHDHNAGAGEMSRTMRRWEWGRVHHGDRTEIFYDAESHHGPARSLWITCRDGRPETVRDDAEFLDDRRNRTVFGMRHDRSLLIDSTRGRMIRDVRPPVDAGPFYLRWLADFTVSAGADDPNPITALGMAELLDTGNMNRAWFNWMIPYRLKRPRT